MKLGDWMNLNGVGDDDLAPMVKTDRTTISRIRRGKGRPSWELAARIFEATSREVGRDPNDFLDAAEPQSTEAQS